MHGQHSGKRKKSPILEANFVRLNLCSVLDSEQEAIYAKRNGFRLMPLTLIDLLFSPGSSSVQSLRSNTAALSKASRPRQAL